MVRTPYPALDNPLLNRKNATYKPFVDRAERSGVELYFTECSSVVESSHDAKPERDLDKVRRDLASAAWTDVIWCGKTPIACARDLGLLETGAGGVTLAEVALNVPQRADDRGPWPPLGRASPGRTPTTLCLSTRISILLRIVVRAPRHMPPDALGPRRRAGRFVRLPVPALALDRAVFCHLANAAAQGGVLATDR